MSAVVFHCHPSRDSYSEALLARTRRGLARAERRTEVYRLGEGDDPDPARLVGAETLVAVHPTWWGGLPAPLLDWVQRRLSPWIDHGAARAACPLRSIDQLIAVTTHGSSELINRLQGEPGRQLYRHVLRPLSASGAGQHWIALYKVDRARPEDLARFLDHTEDRVAAITSGEAVA